MIGGFQSLLNEDSGNGGGIPEDEEKKDLDVVDDTVGGGSGELVSPSIEHDNSGSRLRKRSSANSNSSSFSNGIITEMLSSPTTSVSSSTTGSALSKSKQKQQQEREDREALAAAAKLPQPRQPRQRNAIRPSQQTNTNPNVFQAQTVQVPTTTTTTTTTAIPHAAAAQFEALSQLEQHEQQQQQQVPTLTSPDVIVADDDVVAVGGEEEEEDSDEMVPQPPQPPSQQQPLPQPTRSFTELKAPPVPLTKTMSSGRFDAITTSHNNSNHNTTGSVVSTTSSSGEIIHHHTHATHDVIPQVSRRRDVSPPPATAVDEKVTRNGSGVSPPPTDDDYEAEEEDDVEDHHHKHHHHHHHHNPENGGPPPQSSSASLRSTNSKSSKSTASSSSNHHQSSSSKGGGGGGTGTTTTGTTTTTTTPSKSSSSSKSRPRRHHAAAKENQDDYDDDDEDHIPTKHRPPRFQNPPKSRSNNSKSSKASSSTQTTKDEDNVDVAEGGGRGRGDDRPVSSTSSKNNKKNRGDKPSKSRSSSNSNSTPLPTTTTTSSTTTTTTTTSSSRPRRHEDNDDDDNNDGGGGKPRPPTKSRSGGGEKPSSSSRSPKQRQKRSSRRREEEDEEVSSFQPPKQEPLSRSTSSTNKNNNNSNNKSATSSSSTSKKPTVGTTATTTTTATEEEERSSESIRKAAVEDEDDDKPFQPPKQKPLSTTTTTTTTGSADATETAAPVEKDVIPAVFKDYEDGVEEDLNDDDDNNNNKRKPLPTSLASIPRVEDYNEEKDGCSDDQPPQPLRKVSKQVEDDDDDEYDEEGKEKEEELNHNSLLPEPTTTTTVEVQEDTIQSTFTPASSSTTTTTTRAAAATPKPATTMSKLLLPPPPVPSSMKQYIYTGEEEDEGILIPQDIQYVQIEKGVTYIAEGAFSEHPTLTRVDIPSSVIEIGSQAFANCEKLTTVHLLGNGLELISEFAFSGCTALTRMDIPSTVTIIGQDAFFCCDQLEEVIFHQEDEKPQEQDEEASSSYLTHIRVNSFRRCKSLQSIVIPKTVTHIGFNAFDACTSLSSIKLYSPEEGGCLESIGKSSFIYCESLTEIQIPSSVTEIGKEAFFNCKLLQSIIFGSSNDDGSMSHLQKIGFNAFGCNTSLTAITIPPSVIEIGDSAFAGCEALTSVQLMKPVPEDDTTNKTDVHGVSTTNMTAAARAGKLQSIGFKAFSACKALTTIEIPPGVEDIGEQLFYDCEALHTVILHNGPKAICHFAFRACTALKSIDIPGSVKAIGPEAFYDCNALTTVNFHNGLTTIGESSFGACKALTSIKLPSSLQVLGKEAFFECTSLTNVTLKKGLTYIGESAFASCKSLESMDIPSSVDEIGKEAFLECEKLTSVKMNRGLKIIGNKAFRACKSLTHVDLPVTVEEIHSSAFVECDALATVTLPPKLSRVDKNVFRVCKSLKTIEIPEAVVEIGGNAFYKCEALETVYLPEGLQIIGKGAFKGCKLLSCMELPESVHEVDESALSGCTLLESIPATARRFDELPLHRLCYQVDTSVLTFRGALDEYGALVKDKDMHGLTAMHVLVSGHNGSMEIFNVLLDAFPSVVSMKDPRGRCPIHMAWNRRLWRLHVIQALCTSESLAPDNNGTFPLDTAIRHGMPTHLQEYMYSLCPMDSTQLTSPEDIPQLKKIREQYVSHMLANPPESLEVFSRDKQHGWVEFISQQQLLQDCPDDIQKIIDFVNDQKACSKFVVEVLAYAKDKAGRHAIDVADEQLKIAFSQRLLFLGRYKLSEAGHNTMEGRNGLDCCPVHRSEKCLVLFASDTLKPADDEHHQVAMKFLSDEDQFDRELRQRAKTSGDVPLEPDTDIPSENWKFDAEHVVPLLRFHTCDMTLGNQHLIGCLVMPMGERNLHQIIDAEGIAGTDLVKVVSVARDIAESLQYLHAENVLHGNFKPRNLIRLGPRMKLVDFNASVKMGGSGGTNSFITTKSSSAYISPEVAMARFKANGCLEEIEKKLHEYEKIKIASPILWNDGLSEKYEELQCEVEWIMNGGKVDVEAVPAIDVWSYGVVLYKLLTGKHLFPCDTNDELMDEVDKKRLVAWKGLSDTQLGLILQNCRTATQGDKEEAKEILRLCLERDPLKRPSMDTLLSLSFFCEKRDQVFLKHVEAVEEIWRTKEETDSLVLDLHQSSQEVFDHFAYLTHTPCPYLFTVVGEKEFQAQQHESKAKQSDSGGDVASEISRSLDRASKFVAFATKCSLEGKRDDWLFEKVYDDAAGRVVQVAYLQILCSLTLKPVVSYRIESKKLAPTLSKMARFSSRICGPAVKVASLFTTKQAVPRIFGIPVSSIPDENIAAVDAFRRGILDFQRIEGMNKLDKKGTKSELKEFHLFMKELEKESKVCQLSDDYDTRNVSRKKWEDALEVGWVFEGTSAQQVPTYVAKQYSKRMGGLGRKATLNGRKSMSMDSTESRRSSIAKDALSLSLGHDEDSPDVEDDDEIVPDSDNVLQGNVHEFEEMDEDAEDDPEEEALDSSMMAPSAGPEDAGPYDYSEPVTDVCPPLDTSNPLDVEDNGLQPVAPYDEAVVAPHDESTNFPAESEEPKTTPVDRSSTTFDAIGVEEAVSSIPHHAMSGDAMGGDDQRSESHLEVNESPTSMPIEDAVPFNSQFVPSVSRDEEQPDTSVEAYESPRSRPTEIASDTQDSSPRGSRNDEQPDAHIESYGLHESRSTTNTVPSNPHQTIIGSRNEQHDTVSEEGYGSPKSGFMEKSIPTDGQHATSGWREERLGGGQESSSTNDRSFENSMPTDGQQGRPDGHESSSTSRAFENLPPTAAGQHASSGQREEQPDTQSKGYNDTHAKGYESTATSSENIDTKNEAASSNIQQQQQHAAMNDWNDEQHDTIDMESFDSPPKSRGGGLGGVVDVDAAVFATREEDDSVPGFGSRSVSTEPPHHILSDSGHYIPRSIMASSGSSFHSAGHLGSKRPRKLRDHLANGTTKNEDTSPLASTSRTDASRTDADESQQQDLESIRDDIRSMLRNEVEAMQDEIIKTLQKDMKKMSKGGMADTSCKCKASCVIL